MLTMKRMQEFITERGFKKSDIIWDSGAEGECALVAWCGGNPSVSFHDGPAKAWEVKQGLDETGCGGRCSGKHDVYIDSGIDGALIRLLEKWN